MPNLQLDQQGPGYHSSMPYQPSQSYLPQQSFQPMSSHHGPQAHTEWMPHMSQNVPQLQAF
ncbi:MAG TPA: hypothetical protein DIW81_30515 [Planctomycetaceae bacterium]|nr:hypothetical protein [Planctomycetaceae bacterium]